MRNARGLAARGPEGAAYEAAREAQDHHGAAAALHDVKEVVEQRLLAVQRKLVKLVQHQHQRNRRAAGPPQAAQQERQRLGIGTLGGQRLLRRGDR